MRFIDILTSEERQYIEDMHNKNYVYTPIKYTNADLATSMLNACFEFMRKEPRAKIAFFFDIDFDGLASGYIARTMVQEVSRVSPDRLITLINKQRVHGLTEAIVSEINSNHEIVLTIIVDSSTNQTELLEQLNCNVIVIDHHDLEVTKFTGKTKHGDYIIVNNNIDNIKHKSAAEVVYEFWHEISPEVLTNLQLEEWVAISLYSDVIDYNTKQNMWFMSFLYDIGPNRDIRKIIEPLGLLCERDGKQCLTRDKISFSLVPLVNSCMRLQCGRDLIDTIIYRPNTIVTFKNCVLKQKDLTLLLCRLASSTDVEGISFVKINKTLPNKPLNALSIMQNTKDKALLSSVDESVLDGFNGLIATKYAEANQTTALAYSEIEEDGVKKLKGSVRTGGAYKSLQLRTYLKDKPNWTASGHGDAFGFTYNLTNGSIEEAAKDIKSILSTATTNELHQRVFNMPDYNFLTKLVNTQNTDTVKDILAIAELQNLITVNDRYYFTFTVGEGFRKPVTVHLTAAVAEHIFEGLGQLRIKLKSFNDNLDFNNGETYEVYLEGVDGNSVLGTLTKLTDTSN